MDVPCVEVEGSIEGSIAGSIEGSIEGYSIAHLES
jgi:hypothetical protein